MKTRNFSSELIIKATRSQGKGGQNINKVSSKVELGFNVPASALLTHKEKTLLVEKWSNRLAKNGTLRMVCQEDRSQLKNKETVIKKFYDLLRKSLQTPKKRIPSQPSEADNEERMKRKKLVAQKKEGRKVFREWE